MMDLDPPLISILVPAYNAANYLPELCRSIQAQTHQNFEVLILDDGSTDNTQEVVREFLKDDRFRYTDGKRNRGLNAVWHQLLEQMRGAYWVSPGADDRLEPEFLVRRLAVLAGHPQACLVHGPPLIINEQGRVIPSPYPKLSLPEMMDSGRALNVLLQHNIINQPSALVRSDATRRVLPFFQADWKYAPDWYLWILLVATGAGIAWDNHVLNAYRIHPQSLSCDPAKNATRGAEIRLAPFCALQAAATLSPAAASAWEKWGNTLYCLWLMRMVRLRGALNLPVYFKIAAAARYGAGTHLRRPFGELCRHLPQILLSAQKERRAARHQLFGVSGLAQIDDPVFNSPPSTCALPS
jgi:glycosyltransferase involved in cell wall biosynthesis